MIPALPTPRELTLGMLSAPDADGNWTITGLTDWALRMFEPGMRLKLDRDLWGQIDTIRFTTREALLKPCADPFARTEGP